MEKLTEKEISELAIEEYGNDPHSFGCQRDGFKRGIEYYQRLIAVNSFSINKLRTKFYKYVFNKFNPYLGSLSDRDLLFDFFLPYINKQEDGWIDINDERYPKIGIAVMVHLKSGYISVGYRKETENGVYWQIFGDIIEEPNYDSITHWMPLPKSPLNK